MREALSKTLRTALESAVVKARDIAELATREAIERLGIAEAVAPSYLDKGEAKLRVKLRAHGRSLGDIKAKNGGQGIERLVSEAAYEHWHRMLFARFLEQNSLLMYDANTSLTLEECEELAVEDGAARNGWEYAGQLAAKMLPQVFRNDSPVFGLSLALNHVRDLEELISKLDLDTFQAQDSLGWVYQFWQTKRKQQVNDSGVKIGADEISPVTQLFTEPYMVSFLLDNALGAWWANRVLTQNDVSTASSEQDLRERAAIAGVPLKFLRFVKVDNNQWEPAGGDFEQWPQHLSELKTLDPCCGSGHFLVAAFLMLVPMRVQLEDLDAKEAIDKVIQQNLHGLELDQRCVELAAFALALEAWRFPKSNGKPLGYRQLPELQLACSGLSVQAAKAEWKASGVKLQDESGKKNIAIALDWMHQTFNNAPILGSLINPKRSEATKIVEWDTLSEALDQALAVDSADAYEARIAAKGMAKAATLLAGQYSWVITNVPFRQMDDLDVRVKEYAIRYHSVGKTDLATVFQDRIMDFLKEGGCASIVIPQGFLYKDYYSKFRVKIFESYHYPIIARLGSAAFSEISGEEVKVSLSVIIKNRPNSCALFYQIDASDETYDAKPEALLADKLIGHLQNEALISNKNIVILHSSENSSLLEEFSGFSNGIQTGDYPRFGRFFWEHVCFEGWRFQLTTVEQTANYAGRTRCIYWGNGELLSFVESKLGEGKSGAWIRGLHCQEKKGVAISAMGKVKATLYNGEIFDDNTVVIIPNDPKQLQGIWELCSAAEYNEMVRSIDQSNKVRGALLRVPYEGKLLEKSLPSPYTSDQSQWIFHGHPSGSVVWQEENQATAIGEFRKDNTVLHIAIARLIGYRWPAELDLDMDLASEQRQWVEACDLLLAFVDDDGIACLPSVRGELSAADRLLQLLEVAYGDAWNHSVLTELNMSVGANSLDAWLRDKFFVQHCKLFRNRPFIWQIWDGLKDGFSALVNYHQFDHDNLDRLIYTYLGDWIRTQEHGVKNKVDGADIRLTAALNLKRELEAIKEGEASADGKSGYDIFVRWKPLEQQPIGWEPDLNDGVRLNIRPFMTAADMGKKGAGVLRAKPNIHWKKDKGNDVSAAPWYTLGEEYDEKVGARINDHHLTLAEKLAARESAAQAIEQASGDEPAAGKLL